MQRHKHLLEDTDAKVTSTSWYISQGLCARSCEAWLRPQTTNTCVAAEDDKHDVTAEAVFRFMHGLLVMQKGH